MGTPIAQEETIQVTQITKQDIINYCMNSPENTNPAVLGSLLDQFNTGGSTGMEPILIKIEDDVYTSTTTFAEAWKKRKGLVSMLVLYGEVDGAGETYPVDYVTYGTDDEMGNYMVIMIGSGSSATTLAWTSTGIQKVEE